MLAAPGPGRHSGRPRSLCRRGTFGARDSHEFAGQKKVPMDESALFGIDRS